MSTLDDYENSKTRLNELAAAHLAAVKAVQTAKIAYDDATAAANKLLEQLGAENERYMALERQVEQEKPVPVGEGESTSPFTDDNT